MVGDDQRRVHFHRHAQPGAVRAGAVGAVEGEAARLDFAQREHVARAGELLGEDAVVVLVEHADPHDAVAQLQRLLDAVGQPAGQRLPLVLLRVRRRQRDSVDHHVDRVALVFLQRDLFVERAHLAVDSRPHEAARAGLVEHLLMLALAVADHGREHQQPRFGRQRQHVVDHLLHGLLGDRVAADWAVRAARAREQQPQVVVNLRHRADG